MKRTSHMLDQVSGWFRPATNFSSDPSSKLPNNAMLRVILEMCALFPTAILGSISLPQLLTGQS